MTALRRLFAPRHIAFVGGAAAAIAIRQCRGIGFTGRISPVHPTRMSMEGLPCSPTVDALDEPPDAAFVAVPSEATVDVIAGLAARGAGGAVCHASGFAEAGRPGQALQAALVEAAGDMPLIGPNCLGILNYLDGVALWPDQHGGRRVDRGVAVITQSGNVGQHLTMQRRSLPLAQLVAVGNSAVTGVAELIDALLADERVTAIGLHVEDLADVAAIAKSAQEALRRRVPIVVLKSGSSELGARANLGHTSSLASSDALADALFARTGMGRVHDLECFVETLKFLHVHGALAGSRIASASCSGGEAALVADTADRRGVAMPPFPGRTQQRLHDALDGRVTVRNPLDFHTYIWGHRDKLTACFDAFLGAGFDAHLLVLDFPRDDRCDPRDWDTAVDAFTTARRRTNSPATVVSHLPEGLPEHLAERLLAEGIAPMQGLSSCIEAIAVAHRIGRSQCRSDAIRPLDPVREAPPTNGTVLHEYEGKRALSAFGIDTPDGELTTVAGALAAARRLGFPVVAKAASADLAHKSDAGGVRLGLANEQQLDGALAEMGALAETFVVERMIEGVVAELIVGVHRDDRFGLALTVGAGGVFVELLRDTATLLLPTSRAEVRGALEALRIWPLLTGFRGRPIADTDALLDATLAVARYAENHRDRLLELEVNPLLVLPEGRGAVAADVLIRHGDPATAQEVSV